MGEDKALLPFASSPTLTQFQLSRLKKIFTDVYISCKKSSKFSFNANFIEDINSENIFAPTSGFISMFEKLQVQKIFVISVDSPFISEYEINTLIEQDKDTNDATIAKTQEGIQPMCGVYHRSLEASFLKMQKENKHKLGQLLKNSKTDYIFFDDVKPFLNLNNPWEYQKALTLI